MECKEPVRVLQIIGISCDGGVEAVILNYYRHMDRSKVQFYFVVHKNPSKNFVKEVKKGGGRIYEVTPYMKNVFAFTYEIYRIVRDGRYEIVHSNMNSLSVFPLFAAWLAGAKIRILHNHTTDTKAEGLRTLIKRVLRPLAKLFANQYWACSELAAKWMYGERDVSDGKITIIPNAIDLKKFAFNQEKRDRLRSQLGIKDELVIGHVGRFMKQKNHDFLIDVFESVVKEKPDAKLLLIGEGPLEHEIKVKVTRLSLEHNVLFLGVRSDVADLYNVMDIFVLPSFYEGLPVVGVEAQANGLKCLFSVQVTKESKLLQETEFLAIENGTAIWKKAICHANISRKCAVGEDMPKLMNFDISRTSSYLQKKYIR
ncbi:MAG: glycosyltransferase family 1 protein [Anaerovibrio sp.]